MTPRLSVVRGRCGAGAGEVDAVASPAAAAVPGRPAGWAWSVWLVMVGARPRPVRPPCRTAQDRRGDVDLARRSCSGLYAESGAGPVAFGGRYPASGWRESRVVRHRVDAHRHPVGRVARAGQPVELLDQVADAQPELVDPFAVEPRVPDEGPQPALLLGGERLGRRDGEVVLVGREVMALDRDRHGARGPPVEALLDGPHPAGAHHLQQPGAVQHPDVVGDGALGAPGRLGQLGHRGLALGEQPEHRGAQRVGQGAHLLGPGDDEPVGEVVAGGCDGWRRVRGSGLDGIRGVAVHHG